jgi:hypothetical protein
LNREKDKTLRAASHPRALLTNFLFGPLLCLPPASGNAHKPWHLFAGRGPVMAGPTKKNLRNTHTQKMCVCVSVLSCLTVSRFRTLAVQPIGCFYFSVQHLQIRSRSCLSLEIAHWVVFHTHFASPWRPQPNRARLHIGRCGIATIKKVHP